MSDYENYYFHNPEENANDDLLWDALKKHLWHSIEIVCYGDPSDPHDICLECVDCGEVVLEAELYTLGARSTV